MVKSLTITALVSIGLVWADVNRNAYKQLEKLNFERATELLQRSVEKDSINPGAWYVYSLIFSHPDYPGRSVDSAYYFICKAERQWESASDALRADVLRNGWGTEPFVRQHSLLDSLAFEQATQKHTLAAYQAYLSRYVGARQTGQAIAARNALAFESATLKGTWQAYLAFTQEYPEADERAEATQRYQQLQYSTFTRSGEAESYARFLEQFPDNPYRSEALSKLFAMRTADHAESDYAAFIKQYPGTGSAQTALDRLYHLYRERKESHLFFAKYREMGSALDSLREIDRLNQKTLFPVFSRESMALADERGKVLLTLPEEQLPQDSHCQVLSSDLILTLRGNEKMLRNRDGALVLQGTIVNIADLGEGLLRVDMASGTGLLHKNGSWLLAPEYEDLQLLDRSLVIVKEAGRYGLMSMNGVRLLESQLDYAEQLGPFVVLSKGDRLAVTLPQHLHDLADGAQLNLSYRYDEAELFRDRYLIAIEGAQESVLNEALEVIIPPRPQELNRFGRYWTLSFEGQYQVYDEYSNQYSAGFYDQVMGNDSLLLLHNAGSWYYQSTKADFAPLGPYDSLRLLADDVLLTVRGGKSTLLLGGNDSLLVGAGQQIRVLHPPQSDDDTFILTSDGTTRRLYSPQGKQLLGGRFDDLNILHPSLFVIEERGKKGISDTTSQNILPIRYQTISGYDRGWVSLVEGGRFGAFRYPQGQVIKPAYEKPLQVINDSLLLAVREGKTGVIAPEGKVILPFDFDEVRPWSAKQYLVRQELNWYWYTPFGESPLSEPFTIIEWLDEQAGQRRIIYRTSTGVGLASSKPNLSIAPTLSDLVSLEAGSAIIYLGEVAVPQADLHVLIYYDQTGQRIRSQAVEPDLFDRVFCN